jgi:hypothetical protein
MITKGECITWQKLTQLSTADGIPRTGFEGYSSLYICPISLGVYTIKNSALAGYLPYDKIATPFEKNDGGKYWNRKRGFFSDDFIHPWPSRLRGILNMDSVKPVGIVNTLELLEMAKFVIKAHKNDDKALSAFPLLHIHPSLHLPLNAKYLVQIFQLYKLMGYSEVSIYDVSKNNTAFAGYSHGKTPSPIQNCPIFTLAGVFTGDNPEKGLDSSLVKVYPYISRVENVQPLNKCGIINPIPID